MAFRKKLGERIRSVRLKKGITLEKVAYGAEISKGNLSEIETGLRDPRFATLKAISSCIGISLSELIKDL